jgi:hypothetical protein
MTLRPLIISCIDEWQDDYILHIEKNLACLKNFPGETRSFSLYVVLSFDNAVVLWTKPQEKKGYSVYEWMYPLQCYAIRFFFSRIFGFST